MKAILFLFAATLVGTAGGYIWSGHSTGAPAPAAAVAQSAPAPSAIPVTAKPAPIAIASAEPTVSISAEDRAWSTRGAASSDSSLHQQRTTERRVYYAGCNAVRAAGAAPLYAGQPGYRIEMDGDGDGVACEPVRRR